MTLQLFRNFEEVPAAIADPSGVDYYAIVEQMRQAVRAGSPEWAKHPEVQAYADVCFWAIRKLEYGFAARAFAEFETNARPLRILDVGCGVVPFCNWMSRRGHSVTAIDPSIELIGLLTRNNVNGFYGSRVTYEVGRGEDLQFADASFDLVTCVSVLEHVPPGSDRLALRHIARVLKPGGVLVLTFDTSPPPVLQAGELPWPPEKRRYAQPFAPAAAERLLSSLTTSFEVSAADLPRDLYELDWETVHRFWRAAQAHDGRKVSQREYVAAGGVLRRASAVPDISPTETNAAYREGLQALEERLAFFQLHAERRLEVVHSLEDRIHLLQSELAGTGRELPHVPPDMAELRSTLSGHREALVELGAVDEVARRGELGAAYLLAQNASSLLELVDQVAEIAHGSDGRRRFQDGHLVRDRLDAVQRTKADVEAIAEARQRVIDQQSAAIERYRRTQLRTRLARHLSSLTAPQMGVFEQYAPRPIEIPPWYRASAVGPCPSISIVTPTLNQGQFIERTLASVLEQNYPRLQYIVQDGGSRDETLSVLDRYRSSLARITSESDNGFAQALNRGFRCADGEILAYLNSDDLLLPGSVRYVADYFRKHPRVDVVYGHRVVIDRHDGEIGRWVMPPHDDEVLSWADYVPQETLFWRRRIWEQCGGAIDESFRFAIDWDLLLRFRAAGARMVRLPRFLGAFRVHPAQKTSGELIAVGGEEMERLRRRSLGRPVSGDEIRRALSGYLRSHFILHKLYRLGLMRY